MSDRTPGSAKDGSTSGATPVTARDDEEALPAARATRATDAERYVLDREIGHGGMGRVFAGRDLRLGRTVAIKILRAPDPALATRFEREVKLAARLQHPGVVPVYDAGFWPSGEPFLVMKLVLGQSLARRIRDADTRADRLALLPEVIAAAEAVAYAHDAGVVHRDLKPSNILVGAFGETVVVDWGLAKDLRAGTPESGAPAPSPPLARRAGESAADESPIGAVVGTPSYMSPEQAAGRPVDPRTDVYALGAILHYVLAGTVPQPGTSLAALEPHLPPDLLAIVNKALAPEAARRYPSAFELADDLKRFASGQLVAARRYSRLTRAGRFAARHPIAVATAVAIAFALLAVTTLSAR
jgi:serine/threonine protein kinase